jgi:hypothetical protein
VSAGIAGLASKAAAGIAAAAIVTAGAAEVREVATHVNEDRNTPAAVSAVAPRASAPVSVRPSSAPAPVAVAVAGGPGSSAKEPIEEPVPPVAATPTVPVADPGTTTTAPPTTTPAADPGPAQPEDQGGTQEDGSTIVLTPGEEPADKDSGSSGTPPAPPGERTPNGGPAQTLPAAGE